MGHLILILFYIVALDFGARIFMYWKTGDARYKHNYDAWRKRGKHEK